MRNVKLDFRLIAVLCCIFVLPSSRILAQTCTLLPPNTVAWLSGDGNTIDISGNNNNGNPSGVVYTGGKVAQAFRFGPDGGGSSFGVPPAPSLNFTSALTIEAWVNPATPNTFVTFTPLVDKGYGATGSDPTYLLNLNPNTLRVQMLVGSPSNYTFSETPDPLPLNTFTHIAGTYDGATVRIYVNGVLADSDATNIGSLVANNHQLRIGQSASFGNLFFGTLDEVTLYNRVLSAAEIQSIAAADSFGKCAVNISGVVSYAITPSNQTAKLVSGVTLTLAGASSESVLTNSGGSYSFNNLTAGGSYTVTPTKTGGANGITAFDSTLVLRHVAANGQGASALNPNQQKAADTDGDGFVTAFDATLILRYVAANGANANTGQVGNWKFQPPMRSYSALNGRNLNQNYEAILIGDVDGDWAPQSNLQPEDDGMNEDKKTFHKLKIN